MIPKPAQPNRCARLLCNQVKLLNNRCILLSLLLVAWLAGAAEVARAQQKCPEIKIFCPKAVTTQMRCSALVSGSENPELTYEWSVSLPIKIQKFPGQENEIGIDLTQFPGYALTVTVKVGGLPDGCPYYASFELNSQPEESRPSTDSSSKLTSTTAAIILNCSESVDEGAPAYFNAAISDAAPTTTPPVYQWSVSSGKITGGQGTRTIAVDTTDQGKQIIRATLKVKGYGAQRTITCSTEVKALPKAYKLAEYRSLDLEEEAIRLQRFFLRLKAGLDERAYIIAYRRRNGTKDEAEKLAARARDYLVTTCGIDAARVETILGGEREDATIELWVVATGGTPPVPNPSASGKQAGTSKTLKTGNRKEKKAQRAPRFR